MGLDPSAPPLCESKIFSLHLFVCERDLTLAERWGAGVETHFQRESKGSALYERDAALHTNRCSQEILLLKSYSRIHIDAEKDPLAASLRMREYIQTDAAKRF